MQPYPHHYTVTAMAQGDSDVSLSSPGIAPLLSAGPAEFGGPGDLWSPESLLSASVADCFVLTFRAIARTSRLVWDELECKVDGVLEEVDGKALFSKFRIKAKLSVGPGTSLLKAEKLLHMAERHCLITNSLVALTELEIELVTVQ